MAKLKYTARALSVEDVVRAHWMSSRYAAKKTGTRDRVRNEFRRFCALNRMPADAAGLYFVGQMSADLLPGTVRVYAEHARLSSNVQDIAAAYHADAADSAHVARRITVQEARQVVFSVAARGGAAATQLFVMTTTGCRCSDATRLRREQLQLAEKFLIVTFKLTKGIRKRSARLTLKIPLPFQPPPRVRAELSKAGAARRLLFSHDSTALNREIRADCKVRGTDGFTSGSFRKMHSTRMDKYLEMHPGADTKSHLMQHLSTRIDDAFYRYGNH
jgi:integrase